MKEIPPIKYYKLNETSGIAILLKSGSTSIAKAVIDAKHPDVVAVPISFPNDGRGANRPGWQGVCPRIESPTTTYAAIREPIDRFRSAFAQTRQSDVDATIARLESGDWFNPHFFPQARLQISAKLYRFPEHLDELAIDAGLGEIPAINDEATNANPDKPILTSEQTARLEALYADDIALYGSITEAGQVYTLPPIPATNEMRAAKIAELERARWDEEVAGITLPDGKFVFTDKETQVELGKALSIISTFNPALEIDWKFPDGEIVHMDATQIQQIAGAVFAHVQATRTAFKDKAALVEAATTKDELDSITW